MAEYIRIFFFDERAFMNATYLAHIPFGWAGKLVHLCYYACRTHIGLFGDTRNLALNIVQDLAARFNDRAFYSGRVTVGWVDAVIQTFRHSYRSIFPANAILERVCGIIMQDIASEHGKSNVRSLAHGSPRQNFMCDAPPPPPPFLQLFVLLTFSTKLDMVFRYCVTNRNLRRITWLWRCNIRIVWNI